MPKVISDSSTLIHLSAKGHLSLLRKLFGELVVPTAVWKEVVEQGQGRPGVEEVETARREGWVHVETVSNELLLRSLKQELDEGEAQVIALAVESRADLVLLDESEARRRAVRSEENGRCRHSFASQGRGDDSAPQTGAGSAAGEFLDR
jgi:hypothetical protein